MSKYKRKTERVKLSPKERAFCAAFTDIDSKETFGLKVASAVRAGFGKNAAVRLIARQDIQAEILRLYDIRMTNSLLSPSKVLSDLEFVRLQAMEKKDLMAAAKCSELQGKFLNMFKDTLQVQMPEVPPLTAADRVYLANLSRLHLAEGSPPLIEASFQPDTEQPAPAESKPFFQKPQDFIE